jgi:putative FmdB family regulatory protein
MPLYDYRCGACGREVEVMHSIHHQGPETCAACGGTMKKVLSPPAIHFKGSGWAKKDAATKAKPKAAKAGAGKDTGADQPKSSAPTTDKDTAAASGAGATSSPAAKGD